VSGLSAPPLPIGLPGRCAVERNRTSDHLLIRQALSPLSYHRPPPRYAAPQHKPQPKHPEARRTRLPLGPLPRTCPKGRVSCPQTPSAPTGTTISANKKKAHMVPTVLQGPGCPPSTPHRDTAPRATGGEAITPTLTRTPTRGGDSPAGWLRRVSALWGPSGSREPLGPNPGATQPRGLAFPPSAGHVVMRLRGLGDDSAALTRWAGDSRASCVTWWCCSA